MVHRVWEGKIDMALGYCVHCKIKVTIKDPQPVRLKNGRHAVQGICPNCGTKIFKMGRLGREDMKENLQPHNGWEIVSCENDNSTWFEGRYDKGGVRITISRADLNQLRQVIDSTEVRHVPV